MHPCISRVSFPFLNCFCFKIWSFYFVFVKIASEARGVGSAVEGFYKVLCGEGPTPYTFVYLFDRKGKSFVCI